MGSVAEGRAPSPRWGLRPQAPSPRWGLRPQAPITAGATLALLSALLFGASTPAVQRLGRGIGPFTTAALLYAGAAAFSVLSSAVRARASAPSPREAPLGLRHAPRVVAVAMAGALFAPAALAWGLRRSSGVAASLLIN